MKENLRDAYLMFVNNYLTVEKFAEDHGLTTEQGHQLITLGRSIHESMLADAGLLVGPH